MSIASDISDLKDLSDGVVANKVSRFAYTEQAYTDNEVNGVIDYDVNRGRNIPVGTASVMKVNQTVIDKGWRARASSITRMLMNHFLGRISYNLNKVNDWFNSFLGSMASYLGAPNGIATLDANGHLSQQSPVGSPYVPLTKDFLSAVFSRLLGREFKQATGNTSSQLGFLVYANGIWVCAETTYQSRAWWSEDGKVWTLCSGITTGEYEWLRGLEYANNIWVCIGEDNIWWSEDGKSWSTATFVSGTPDNCGILYYLGNLWLCCDSNSVWWSEDGKAWTQGTVTANSTLTEVVYAHNMWVACSDHGMWWSIDGKSWTQGTGGYSAYQRMSGLKFANNIWVVLTDGNGIWWSEDGKAWTQGVSYSDGYTGYGGQKTLIYANGIWQAGGSNVWWSTDGKTWTMCAGFPSNTSIGIYDLTYANGMFVGGTNYGGGAWYSTDGKTWYQGNYPLKTSPMLGFAYVNGLWLCTVGSSTDKVGIGYSEDGVNWYLSRNGGVPIFVDAFSCAKGIIVAISNGHTSSGSGNGAWYSDIDDLIANGTIDLGANIPLVNA